LNGLLKTSCAVNEADEMEEGMTGASMPGVSPEKSHVAFGPAAATASASVTVAFTKG
jgi:plastocyanin